MVFKWFLNGFLNGLLETLIVASRTSTHTDTYTQTETVSRATGRQLARTGGKEEELSAVQLSSLWRTSFFVSIRAAPCEHFEDFQQVSTPSDIFSTLTNRAKHSKDDF